MFFWCGATLEWGAQRWDGMRWGARMRWGAISVLYPCSCACVCRMYNLYALFMLRQHFPWTTYPASTSNPRTASTSLAGAVEPVWPPNCATTSKTSHVTFFAGWQHRRRWSRWGMWMIKFFFLVSCLKLSYWIEPNIYSEDYLSQWLGAVKRIS